MLTPEKTAIDGVFLVDTASISDDRGAFARLFCTDELQAIIGPRRIVQINHSKTLSIGAIRGLHYQNPPHAEMKLIRCLRGRVFDVAVDLRCGSPTYLRWQGEELSEENMRMMVIPEGVAHGFQVLAAESELLYLHTAMYRKEAEGGIRYDDPQVSITWPLPVTDISQRDQNHPLLTKSFDGIKLLTANC